MTELLSHEPATGAEETPSWVVEAREGLTVPGKYLAFEDGDRRQVVPVQREWTRIGRSLAADVRFDDATVSRAERAVEPHGRQWRRGG